jgi:hypothetical protein
MGVVIPGRMEENIFLNQWLEKSVMISTPVIISGRSLIDDIMHIFLKKNQDNKSTMNEDNIVNNIKLFLDEKWR